MPKFAKVLLSLFLLTILIAILYGTYHAFIDGNYLRASFFNSIIVVLIVISFSFIILRYIKRIWAMAILLFLLMPAIESCSYAKSNQQVLISEDCGMTWKKINAGDAIPKQGLNYCFMKVVIPNFPMQGDCIFLANLSETVRAKVHIDYDYNIIDGLAFIKQAKSLGKANVDADDEQAINANFESAENRVIDKRLKNVAKELLRSVDIVDSDPSELETKLEEQSGKILEPLGIKLNFITLTFDLDDQTRQAIDVSTAMKIYKSKGLDDLGQKVITARAGATKVSVNNVSPSAAKQDENELETK